MSARLKQDTKGDISRFCLTIQAAINQQMIPFLGSMMIAIILIAVVAFLIIAVIITMLLVLMKQPVLL
jgi:hypothetical protein